MIIYNLKSKKSYDESDIYESDLSGLITNYWDLLFPNYQLIKREFSLHGSVRGVSKGGRIDFLAFNKETKSFVVIELKKNYDKNVRNQIFDYVDFVEDNFEFIYLKSKDFVPMPEFRSINKDVELLLIAKKFKPNDFDRINKISQSVKLIEYIFFENNNLIFNIYQNNNSITKPKIEKTTHSTTIDNPNLFLEHFWMTFYKMKAQNLVIENIDFKLNGPEIILRLGRIYEKYRLFCLEHSELFASSNVIRELLTKSEIFIGVRSSRFMNDTGDVNNAIIKAYRFNYLKLHEQLSSAEAV